MPRRQRGHQLLDDVLPLADGTGASLWPGTRATPTVDRNNVYIHDRDGFVFCYDRLTGIENWHNNSDASGKPAYGGYAGSPIVEGDLLILQSGYYGTALRISDGSKAWGADAPYPKWMSWSSPVVFDWQTNRVAAFRTYGGLYLANARTGAYMGRYERPGTQKVADPVVYGDTIFIGATGGDNPVVEDDVDHTVLVQLGTGELSNVWATDSLACECNTPVIIDGYIYGVSYARGDYLLICMDARDGEVVWSQDLDGELIDGGESGEWVLSAAGGWLFLVSAQNRYGDAGRLLLVRATPRGYETAGEAIEVVPDAGREQWYAQPVLANGLLYLRSSGYEDPEGSGNWVPGRVVCLQVQARNGVAPTDGDLDGMADTWEIEVLGSTTNRPGGDRDGDGASNLNEFRAGTDATNGLESLRLDIALDGRDAVVTCRRNVSSATATMR